MFEAGLSATELGLGLRVGVTTLSSQLEFLRTNTYVLANPVEEHHLGILFVLTPYPSARVHVRPGDILDKQWFREITGLLVESDRSTMIPGDRRLGSCLHPSKLAVFLQA
jgi:hypothetical protein